MASPSAYGIVLHHDGTFTRTLLPLTPASPQFVDGVASKDVTLDPSTGVWARIFLPQASQAQQQHLRFPLLLYFHGGGFVLLSVAHKLYHRFLHRLAKAAAVIVIAVEYRLAPEHRLPAAYDDAFASLRWIRSQALQESLDAPEPWLVRFADFSNCFLMGDSAGANIVHHLSLTLGNLDLNPLCIRGDILIQPFFGGNSRTETEERMANDKHLPLGSTDWLWRNALPEGADRDHPAANPLHLSPSDFKEARIPRTLLMVALKDPMNERQSQYFAKLKEAEVDVEVQFQDGSHGFQLVQGSDAASFIADLTSFINNCRLSRL